MQVGAHPSLRDRQGSGFAPCGKRKVIHIRSIILGTDAGLNRATYRASKKGLVDLTRSPARELGRERISANSLAPDDQACFAVHPAGDDSDTAHAATILVDAGWSAG
jgi:NAD(P)-dependent dehydrogenase (short-subunit alcohol dehydrogenase family)